MNAINTQLPTSFLRSLEPLFMFGVHHFDGNQPFLVLKNSFYENISELKHLEEFDYRFSNSENESNHELKQIG